MLPMQKTEWDSGMRGLITGHRGFIGAVMVPLVQKAGHEVVGLDIGLSDGCDFGRPAAPIHEIRADLRRFAVSAPQWTARKGATQLCKAYTDHGIPWRRSKSYSNRCHGQIKRHHSGGDLDGALGCKTEQTIGRGHVAPIGAVASFETILFATKFG